MKKKSIAVFTAAVLLVFSTRFYAQTGQIDGIAHIAFRVSNLDNEVDFFKKLGYEEPFSRSHDGKTTQAFIKINDRQFIEVYPQTDPPQQLGWMHVCYESADLNALNALLESNGLKPSHVVKAGAGNLIFSLKDPEGRTTEFTQYMPGSLHTMDQGKHLGEHRVSDELIGFELPVADLAAAKQFYTALGFSAEEADGVVRLTAPGNPDMRIELHSPRTVDQAQTLFLVPDARKAADEMHAQGLDAKRHGKLVLLRDPDGNSFVFLEGSPE